MAEQSQGIATIPGFMKPCGYSQLTAAAASGLGTIPDGAKMALIQPETQNVRWRDDGTNPTTAIGMVLAAGTTLQYTGSFSAFKMIEVAATAKINVTFYK